MRLCATLFRIASASRWPGWKLVAFGATTESVKQVWWRRATETVKSDSPEKLNFNSLSQLSHTSTVQTWAFHTYPWDENLRILIFGMIILNIPSFFQLSLLQCLRTKATTFRPGHLLADAILKRLAHNLMYTEPASLWNSTPWSHYWAYL